MACIDIFAPGRLLTVVVLWEQIIIDCHGREFSATEVYDFLLQVDDDKELTEFFIDSPHYCRFQDVKGNWSDSVQFVRIGDHKTGWGWFYYGDEKREAVGNKTLLTLSVPNPGHAFSENAYPLTGEVDNRANIEWDPTFSDDQQMALLSQMAKLKKSRFRVRLGTDPGDTPNKRVLQPYGANKMWFRLIVRPAILDVPDYILQHPSAPWELLVPQHRSILAHISCPSTVRSTLRNKLNTEKINEPAISWELTTRLLTRGIDTPGTSTRIVDHRLSLINRSDVKLTVQGQSEPTLNLYGLQQLKISLPKRCESWRKRSFSKLKLEDSTPTVRQWAGGSQANGNQDLYAVANAILKEIAMRPGAKTVADLAHETATPFAQTCFLIRLMVEAGLIEIEPEDRVRPRPFANGNDLCEAFCKLRRFYLDKGKFLQFPQAQLEFKDMHTFRVDFLCEWTPYPLRRKLLLITTWILGAATFVMAVIGLMRK